MTFDAMEHEYIYNKGWYINSSVLLELTAKQAAAEPYLDRNILEPERHILMIPCTTGCTFLLEGQHFFIKD